MSQEELEDFQLDFLLNKTNKIDTLERIDLIARINEIQKKRNSFSPLFNASSTN
ncbi:MAG: hypothetical protein QXT72_03995 [Candidatus Micrarchaeia archaeon]